MLSLVDYTKSSNEMQQTRFQSENIHICKFSSQLSFPIRSAILVKSQNFFICLSLKQSEFPYLSDCCCEISAWIEA